MTDDGISEVFTQCWSGLTYRTPVFGRASVGWCPARAAADPERVESISERPDRRGPQPRSGRHVEPEERAERESASVTESFRRHGPSVTRFVTTHDASYIRDAALISF